MALLSSPKSMINPFWGHSLIAAINFANNTIQYGKGVGKKHKIYTAAFGDYLFLDISETEQWHPCNSPRHPPLNATAELRFYY